MRHNRRGTQDRELVACYRNVLRQRSAGVYGGVIAFFTCAVLDGKVGQTGWGMVIRSAPQWRPDAKMSGRGVARDCIYTSGVAGVRKTQPAGEVIRIGGAGAKPRSKMLAGVYGGDGIYIQVAREQTQTGGM